ncbi:MAG: efflux RND transporter periplasmic adaptor subunit [Pseudomonadota bacterium]
MIAFLTLLYVGLLAVLVWLKVLPNKLGTWLTTIAWVLLLFIVLFIPMQWGAPAGSIRAVTPTVQIIPNVAGPVLEVPVEPNTPLKTGDVLFTIDPTPYEATVEATRAQLNFQKLRLTQFEQLASTAAGTKFQVEETEARVKQLEAELENAEWNLEETTIRAPSNGFVTTVGLRPGQRVVTLPLQPAMTFVDTSGMVLGLQIQQIYIRHVQIGQPVEIALKTRPGRIVTGKVAAVIEVTSGSQVLTSGTVWPAEQITAEPFWIRVELDDKDAAETMTPGAAGTAAVYTPSATMTHIIRKVMIRMESYLNYINPWL